MSVVLPCLDEEAAIGQCVDEARAALEAAGLSHEIIVVDNGCRDRTAEIARAHGARVVREDRPGYGSAYLRGFAEAQGRWVVMADADGSYPLEGLAALIQPIRSGQFDVVVGNRFAGRMDDGAMPFLNRYLGNPVLSAMTRLLFGARVSDIHCGMRAIDRSKLEGLGLQASGMELATEMIVKGIDQGLRFAELDIAYRPRIGASKLRPFQDAWRHVEYMLIFSPVLVFVAPGLLLSLLGLAVQLALLGGPRFVLWRVWDYHTSLAGLAASLTGTTLLVLGVVSCAVARSVRFQFRQSPVARALAQHGNRIARVVGGVELAIGLALWCWTLARWAGSGFGALAAVPVLALGTTLLAGGVGLVGAAFLVHVVLLRSR